MAILLRAMTAAEFGPYRACFIPDYAAEIAANYDVPLPAATDRAEREIERDLPDGPHTPGETLLCIVEDTLGQSPVGYLWHRANAGGGHSFLLDFQIVPEHRGKGYGAAALAALEAELARSGIGELRLRVAADNDRAQHLYRTRGFRTTGINMSKRLGQEAKDKPLR